VNKGQFRTALKIRNSKC